MWRAEGSRSRRAAIAPADIVGIGVSPGHGGLVTGVVMNIGNGWRANVKSWWIAHLGHRLRPGPDLAEKSTRLLAITGASRTAGLV